MPKNISAFYFYDEIEFSDQLIISRRGTFVGSRFQWHQGDCSEPLDDHKLSPETEFYQKTSV